MSTNNRSQIRRRSMLGTALFALGIVSAIACVVTGSIWLVLATVVFLVPAVMMLYQVGKSLPK